MRLAAIISCIGLLAPGALSAGAPCDGHALAIDGRAACVTFGYEKGARDWHAFVTPRDVDVAGAGSAVFDRAEAHCAGMGLRADTALKMKRGGWAAPDTMIYTGTCK